MKNENSKIPMTFEIRQIDAWADGEGTIAGVKFKGLLDLYDPKTGEIYDTKCMKDFSDTYSDPIVTGKQIGRAHV